MRIRIINTAIAVAVLLSASMFGFAQSVVPQNAAPAVQVDQKVLMAYVGRYAFKGDVFFDVALKNGKLRVKAPGQEIAMLVATSQTDFSVKEAAEITFTFVKDATGAVVGLTVHQNGDHTAKKISADIPANSGANFDPDDLSQYIGEYEVKPGFTIKITKENNKLMGQPTNDEKIEFKQVSGTVFTSEGDDPKLKFGIGEANQVIGLTIFLGGQTYQAKKIK